MPYTPSLAQERTALAWQRSALSLAVVAALLLPHGGWAQIAAAVVLAGAAVVASRRRLGCRSLAMVTSAAAVLSALTVATTG
jgi:uncharacterized membrane protein YidH (DUF202 family)